MGKNNQESINLDEIIKMVFSTSNEVLVKLLNGVFDENCSEENRNIEDNLKLKIIFDKEEVERYIDRFDSVLGIMGDVVRRAIKMYPEYFV